MPSRATALTEFISPSRPPTSLFVVTFDGDDPRRWRPWDVEFPDIVSKCELSAHRVPADLTEDETFRFHIDAAADALAAVSNWSLYVGAVVDVSNPRVDARHRQYLSLLNKTKDAMYRRVGYHLFAFTAAVPSQQELNLVSMLMQQVRDRLHTETFLHMTTVPEVLPSQLHSAALAAISHDLLSRK